MSDKKEYTDEEIMNISEDEILQRLLGGYKFPEETVFLKDIGVPLTFKGLDEKTLTKLKNRCTYPVKKGNFTVQELDSDEYNAVVVAAACTNFDFNNPKLLNPLGLSSGAEYLRRKLPAGILTTLVNKVLELSGFGNDKVKNVEIKN